MYYCWHGGQPLRMAGWAPNFIKQRMFAQNPAGAPDKRTDGIAMAYTRYSSHRTAETAMLCVYNDITILYGLLTASLSPLLYYTGFNPFPASAPYQGAL